MSDFEFRPIHKILRVTISSIKLVIFTNTDVIAQHIYNNSTYQITLPLGLLGCCETNAKLSSTQKKAIRVNKELNLLLICQPIIKNEEISDHDTKKNQNETQFTKTL